MATAPVLTYTITYKTYNPITGSETVHNLPLDGLVKRSYATNFNRIDVTYTSDISLNMYEVRATPIGEDYGVGIGSLVYLQYGAITANQPHSYLIEVNSLTFPVPNTTYRVGLYARNAVDNTWDATWLFITSDGLNFLVQPDELNYEVYVLGDYT